MEDTHYKYQINIDNKQLFFKNIDDIIINLKITKADFTAIKHAFQNKEQPNERDKFILNKYPHIQELIIHTKNKDRQYRFQHINKSNKFKKRYTVTTNDENMYFATIDDIMIHFQIRKKTVDAFLKKNKNTHTQKDLNIIDNSNIQNIVRNY